MRKFRYIEKNYEKKSLTAHEIKELDIDFDIQTEGFHILIPLTKNEWQIFKKNCLHI